MEQRGPRKFTVEERAELWRRWRDGEPANEIADALSRQRSSIRAVLLGTGGIAPLPRRRRANHLTFDEREEISRALAVGASMRELARQLGRAPSTISREVARNGGPDGYRAANADARAWKQSKRPKACKLKLNDRLCQLVAEKLRDNWSPEQIAGWLARAHPDDPELQVSHETIYRTLFVQTRGALKKELMSHLRSKRMLRRSKKARATPRSKIVDAIPISERPAEVEDRAVPGHWEGDLLCGSKNTRIATLVERFSRFTMLIKLNGRDATTVCRALTKHVKALPEELRKSLTWDRGREMAKHKEFAVATDVKVYFCDPHSPWQRGANENTNGLLRQYFPKGQPIDCTQAELNRVARQLNNRPRKTLDFRTPAETLNEALH